jgi:hypothetical protein
MSSGWTPESRAKQAQAIRRWKPWVGSTDPRAGEGKSRTSQNAYKGWHWLILRQLIKTLNQVLREQRETLKTTP